MSVELVLLTPVFVALLLLVVALGRIQAARADVDSAARAAARAASIERDPTTARRTGDRTARDGISQRGYRCSTLDVDTTGFTAGGNVTVSVSCTVSLADVTGLGIPGSHTYTARFSEPVDRYRGTR